VRVAETGLQIKMHEAELLSGLGTLLKRTATFSSHSAAWITFQFTPSRPQLVGFKSAM
jgi:hypothetical protein